MSQGDQFTLNSMLMVAEVWTSIWGNKEVATAILIYDAKTFELKKAIEDPRLKTPTGKFNVTNTMKDVY